MFPRPGRWRIAKEPWGGWWVIWRPDGSGHYPYYLTDTFTEAVRACREMADHYR